MPFNYPTITDFMNYFVRDFPYGNDPTTVMQSDISQALTDMMVNINMSLFSNQTNFTNACLNLAAHWLVVNLRNSAQGVAGKYAWLSNSKGAGSVSEGIAIPERILANPEFAQFYQTNYGAKYLNQILPSLAGQVFTVSGRTNP